MRMNFYERALELREETVAHRRWLHTNAEAGLQMPKAQAYIMEQLSACGLAPRKCGHVDGFRITVTGRGAHGAYPQNAIDPINIAVHIYLALEALLAREADPGKACVMTVGQFSAGSVPNIIPDAAVLQGTIRTNDKDSRELLVRRMGEASEKTPEVYGGSAAVEMISRVPPLVCDPQLTKDVAGYMQELPIPGLRPYPGVSANASEDFASIAERVPSTFMYLSAGYLDERGDAPAHNPKVRFNEDVCPIGAGCLAHCAVRWLEEHP